MSGKLVQRSLLWGLLLATWVISTCSEVIAPGENIKSERPEYCTVFTHMVKSGGTTIRDQLMRSTYQSSPPILGLACSTSSSLMQGPTGLCADNLESSAVIASAFAEILRGRLDDMDRQCDFFTMVRHPIDRLVSAFFYCPTDHDLHRIPSKWCSGAQDTRTAKPLLMEYVRSTWKNIGVNQMILSTFCPPKFSGFCSDKQEVGRCPADMTSPEGLDCIERAQEALASYKAVGIFEHFALSMDLFDATIKSPVAKWTADMVSNPGTQSGVRQELFEWAHLNTELRRYLAPDLMLYDVAVSVFKQQTSAALGTQW